MKKSAQEVFELLKEQLKENNKGVINFTLSDYTIIVQQNNVVGNILEEWLDKWMTENQIEHTYNHGQSSPDFWLDNDNKNSNWLEIKSFTGSPNFDIANMRSFISEVIEKPWKLNADYLCIRYTMDDKTGKITIDDIWLNKVWKMSCPSAKWAVKLQEKKGVIYNLRPATWYSSKTDYPTFSNIEHFLSALDYVIKTYPPTSAIGMNWKKKVSDSYKKHYNIPLNIPLWQDIHEIYEEESHTQLAAEKTTNYNKKN